MDIAGLSMNMAQNDINSAVGVKMLHKTMETTESLAVGQVKMITEASVNGVGANFDMRV